MNKNIMPHVRVSQIVEDKDRGNELFKKKKYKEALDIYRNIVRYICVDFNGEWDRVIGRNDKNDADKSVNELHVKNVVNFFKSLGTEKKTVLKATTEVGTQLNGERTASEGEDSCLEDIGSNFVKVCHNISLCYYFLAEYDKSIEYGFYVNEMDSSHFKCLNILGICYEKLKNYQKSIDYFERCKVILLKDSTVQNKKSEINKIDEKLKSIFNTIEKEKTAELITFDHIKKFLQDENSSEEKKIFYINSLVNKKNYIIIKENVLDFLYEVILKNTVDTSSISFTTMPASSPNTNSSAKGATEPDAVTTNTTSNAVENNLKISRACFLTIFKILSKVEYEKAELEKEKEKSYHKKVCINKLEQKKFRFYFDTDYVKILMKLYSLFDENWILKYVKDNMKRLETYQFSKKEDSEKYNMVVDILLYVINILRYVYTINNEFILKIINIYLYSGNRELEESSINVLMYICKKKINLLGSVEKDKRKEFMDNLGKECIDLDNPVVDFHFMEAFKYPTCVNIEIKKIIENSIAIYEKYPEDVEYGLILIFILLNDKNRPTERDTEMNTLIKETVDLYFDIKDIQLEWFVCMKCFFLVDKNIVLNYLIGKREYMWQLLNFINESIGRKPQHAVHLYIEVLLLLFNIPELRLMLNDHIHLYINILKTLPYDTVMLKFIVGSFKLYMHNADFKEKIRNDIDLFNYAMELLNRFSGIFSKTLANMKNNKGDVAHENKKDVQVEGSMYTGENEKEIVDNENKRKTKNLLKDLIEMFLYLSLHVEFKKQLLEVSNKKIFYILLEIGDFINTNGLDNTYKYLYCNIIINLVMTSADEKLRRRDINRNSLANFDAEQIEALEQFYEKLPAAVLNKNDPLIDYGDEDTSRQIIACLLNSEEYKPVVSVKDRKDASIHEEKEEQVKTYKNGYIVNIIYNFINHNFFTVNIAEAVCELISKFVADNRHIGIVLINGGLKLLLQASKHIQNKRNCAKALSDIFICTNPKLIQYHAAYDSLPLLIHLLSDEYEFLILKALMAITNLLIVDENIAITAMQLSLWNKCFDLLSSGSDILRAASLECICNLSAQAYVHQRILEKYEMTVKQMQKTVKKGTTNNSEKREDSFANGVKTDTVILCEEINMADLEILYAFTLEFQNYKAVSAATGALGMLSSDPRLCPYLIRTQKFDCVFSAFNKTTDDAILLRILTFFSNIVFSEHVPEHVTQKIKDTVKKKKCLSDENKQIVELILQ